MAYTSRLYPRPAPPQTSNRVLIMGESPDEREMYAVALRLSGFSTLEASTPADATRLAAELRLVAVILDAGRLGSKPQVAFARRLQHGRPSRLPVIVLTTQAPAAPDRARRAGFERVLLKPCLPQALVHVLEDVLHDQERSVPADAPAHIGNE
jgi:CheY-like chemotaxis protein